MTAVGIWSCQHRELQPINLGKRRESTKPAYASNVEYNLGPRNGKAKAVFGRLSQKDEYEMVGLVESSA